MKTKTKCVVLVGALSMSLMFNVVGVLWGGYLFRLQIEADRRVENIVCSDSENWKNAGASLKYTDDCARVCSVDENDFDTFLYYKVPGTNGISCYLQCRRNIKEDKYGYITYMTFCAKSIFAMWRYGHTDHCRNIHFQYNSQPLIVDRFGDGDIKCGDKKMESKIRTLTPWGSKD